MQFLRRFNVASGRQIVRHEVAKANALKSTEHTSKYHPIKARGYAAGSHGKAVGFRAAIYPTTGYILP
jgi:hypothetical protein